MGKSDSSSTTDVIDAMTAFITGEFSPADYPRRAKGTGAATYINLRMTDEFKQLFDDAAKLREAELGYVTTIGHVVKAYLAEKYDKPAE